MIFTNTCVVPIRRKLYTTLICAWFSRYHESGMGRVGSGRVGSYKMTHVEPSGGSAVDALKFV